MNHSTFKSKFISFLWDLWCIISIIGIWPRFIEPNLITTKKITYNSKSISTIDKNTLNQKPLNLKIVQFTDLHLNNNLSDRFLTKLKNKIHQLDPDLVVFTGDFICFSKMTTQDQFRLKNFLNQISAHLGCYAILGNHDYDSFVSINDEGNYDIIKTSGSVIARGMKRLFKNEKVNGNIETKVKTIGLNQTLLNLIADTPFKLLHNESQLITFKEKALNVCGMGEYMLGRFFPEQAFKDYDYRYPGIVLAHNPDTIKALLKYPGEIILCGHTHGGQINLPWFWKKFTSLENQEFRHGLFNFDKKLAYVNRGVGSVMKFRWFAPPELLLINMTI